MELAGWSSAACSFAIPNHRLWKSLKWRHCRIQPRYDLTNITFYFELNNNINCKMFVFRVTAKSRYSSKRPFGVALVRDWLRFAVRRTRPTMCSSPRTKKQPCIMHRSCKNVFCRRRWSFRLCCESSSDRKRARRIPSCRSRSRRTARRLLDLPSTAKLRMFRCRWALENQ